MRIHTTHTRDAALRELHRVNRWMIAGSVVLTGVLADVAANAFPGKKSTSSTAAKGARRSTQAKRSHGQSQHTTTGVLRAPEQPPQASSEEQSSSSAESSVTPEATQEAPAQETAPAEEAPAQETAHQEEAPAQEAPSSAEAAPEVETSAPVVSGGS